MAKQRNALRAGVVILISIAAAIAIILAIAGIDRFTTKFAQRHVIFSLADDIGGLRQGDEVRLGGLRIGTVSYIHFVGHGSEGNGEPTEDLIDVDIAVPVEYHLNTDAVVGIETTVTGVTTMNISDLGSGPELTDNQSIRGEPSLITQLGRTVTAISPQVADDLKQLHQTLASINRAADDAHVLESEGRKHLADVSASATGALDSIHGWLGPSTGDFHQSMAHVRSITAEVDHDLPPMAASASDVLKHADSAVKKADASLDDVKVIVGHLRSTSAAIRSVVLQNQSRFGEIVAGLRATSDNLDAASIEIRSSPWRLLYKPAPNEIANLNIYDAARQFAQGASDMDDAAAALRDSLKDPDVKPATVQKLYDALTERFEHFKEVEDDLWQKVKS